MKNGDKRDDCIRLQLWRAKRRERRVDPHKRPVPETKAAHVTAPKAGLPSPVTFRSKNAHCTRLGGVYVDLLR
jgi:hypothetical protein